jgi:hypothetical protein
VNAGDVSRPPVRQRGFWEIRWRQFRNAPRPVVRAVGVSLSVAVTAGLLLLAYDVLYTTGRLPGSADLRDALLVAYVVVVLSAGALGTWILVPQPSGSGERARRSAWSAALGLMAAIPIAYLVLVVIAQVVRPLILG